MVAVNSVKFTSFLVVDVIKVTNLVVVVNVVTITGLLAAVNVAKNRLLLLKSSVSFLTDLQPPPDFSDNPPYDRKFHIEIF